MDLIEMVLALFRRPKPAGPEPVAGNPVSVPTPAPLPVDWLALCLPLTKASESCQLETYPDPATGGEPWTIGWGATGPSIVPGVKWSQQQADGDLASRLGVIGRQIDSYVLVLLLPRQKAALADFIYNVGAGNFWSSTLLRKLNANDFAGAAEQFLVWTLANGKVMPGLAARRTRERSLFLTGEWK